MRWLAIGLVSVAMLSREGGAQTFYVATDGNDAWSGRLAAPNKGRTDGPVATLTRARDAVRELKAKGALKAPVKVLVRGGTHPLKETFVLEAQDSGTATCPITYAAFPGERPVISGGRPITGWTRQPDGRWVAPAPAHVFRQLFVNGKRRTLARTPNTGFFRIRGRAAPLRDPKTGKEKDATKIGFRFTKGDIQPWPNPTDINAVVFFHWETAMLRIQSVDAASQTVRFTGPMKWPFWGRQRYYIENAPDALDAPGEWYLDRHKKRVTYVPMPGEDLATADVVASRLEQLVVWAGDPAKGKYVEHVRFEGLSFQHGAYTLPPQGHGDWQAAVTIPAVLQADGARHCAVQRCEIAHVGPYAIWFRQGCSHNRIVQNEIHDIGAGGVRIGPHARPRSPALATTHHVVSNNFVHDIGHLFYGAVGVWIGQSSDNTITHNEICDTYYTGISCGWSWGFHPTSCHRNAIEFNHIHHIGRGMLCDLGAIYTLGVSTGTTLRHNLILHVWDWEEGYGAGGIYPDEGSSGLVIENNVIYMTATGGVTVHYGRDNIVRNNILAFGRDGQLGFGRADKKSGLTFTHNIVYYDQGALCAGTDSVVADRNVYFHTRGEPVLFLKEATFAQWQAKGFDKHSVVADPMFVDAKRFDFRLRKGSPALKLGFQPIDVSQVGLVGPTEWVNRPQRIQRPAFAMPRRPEPEPHYLVDDFEDTLVGVNPDWAVTHGEAKGATIRVTDGLAAGGRKCLQFTDGPGLDQIWNPHMYYQPHIRKGMVRLTFDLRFEPGAVIWHEWRDQSHPYRKGPSLSVGADGRLRAGKRTLAHLPADRWVRFDVHCGMGTQATGTWTLAVTVAGQKPQRFDRLPCDPKCRRLEWLGFVSNATVRKVFYLDNLKLEAVKP